MTAVRLDARMKALREEMDDGVDVVRGIFDDFKQFINRGNVVDLAVGIIIGAAFTSIVNSLVNDIIGPIIGLATQGTLSEAFVVLRYGVNHTEYNTREQAKANGAITLNYGNFFQAIINFFIIAMCMYLLVKVVFMFYRGEVKKSTDWPCPKCRELVKEGATRCAHCCAEPIAPKVEPLESTSDTRESSALPNVTSSRPDRQSLVM